MKAKDLHLLDFLKPQAESGIIRLLNHRVVIMDALALGLLHKELREAVGTGAARAVLSRFGYAHGWRTAESLKDEWSELLFSDADTGPWLHTMQGAYTHLSLTRTTNGAGNPVIISTWKDSWEVEQHRLHFGEEEEPVCWTITAFASGYVSCRLGREILFVEQECCAQGASACVAEGRLREDWKGAHQEQLCYCEPATVETLLPEMHQRLKHLEQSLEQERRRIAELDTTKVQQRLSAHSSAMQEVIALAARVAQSEASVVLSGESGVGKEKIARFIHEHSGRAEKPFMAINCGALTESLLESELFGHARGAFTDATSARAGLFEAADGGTLFLDEVGEISPAMQVKLLRVIQEREVRRIGENSSRAVDLRLLSATNRNLAEEIEAGNFRKDLYYRLRVIEVKVPPLRKRTADILPLARFFLEGAARRGGNGRKRMELSAEAARLLLQHHWPGNVRELENTVEYAVALCRNEEIGADDLPEELHSAGIRDRNRGSLSLKEVEQEHIHLVLEETGGQKQRAAEILGIGVATLYRRLKEG